MGAAALTPAGLQLEVEDRGAGIRARAAAGDWAGHDARARGDLVGGDDGSLLQSPNRGTCVRLTRAGIDG